MPEVSKDKFQIDNPYGHTRRMTLPEEEEEFVGPVDTRYGADPNRDVGEIYATPDPVAAATHRAARTSTGGQGVGALEAAGMDPVVDPIAEAGMGVLGGAAMKGGELAHRALGRVLKGRSMGKTGAERMARGHGIEGTFSNAEIAAMKASPDQASKQLVSEAVDMLKKDVAQGRGVNRFFQMLDDLTDGFGDTILDTFRKGRNVADPVYARHKERVEKAMRFMEKLAKPNLDDALTKGPK